MTDASESSWIVHVRGKAFLAGALVGSGALPIDTGLTAVSLTPGSKLVLIEDEAFSAAPIRIISIYTIFVDS